ncbi:MAG: carbohydrate ABC transporter permease [Clostridia bacterium]|nr:carbohydrate ABC transporter permease [Clostridia bacterium]MBR5986848.1 carbohydrate ABC transporter permease [Clostridia bacterium]
MAAVRKSKFDRVFDGALYVILGFLALTYIYALIYVVSASFSDPNAVYSGRVVLWPVDFTLNGYERVFKEKMLWYGYGNSLLYMTVGSVVSTSFTLMGAYALSRKDLPGRGIITGLLVFTMFFSGGIIPLYLVVRSLSLIDTIWALVLPGAVSMSNVIIARTFYVSSIPTGLLDAAKIDGCNNVRFFFRVALPLSKAIIAVITLYYAVGLWNDYFNAMIYIKTREKYPLQLFLREILISSQQSSAMTGDVLEQEILAQLQEIIKYTLIVVGSVPLLLLYPFLQKYFVQGVLIGSLKE